LRAALLAIAVAACGEGGSPGTDGGPTDDGGADDGTDGDAGEPSGLTVDFGYLGGDGEPVPVDQPIELDGFSISALTIQIHRVRLTGDSTLGDELVTRSGALELPASGSSRVAFPTAPPGLYSQLDWRVERTYSDEERPPGFEGQRLSIRVLGEATVEQGTLPFEYVDDKKIDVEIGFAEEVRPDDPGQVSIELDVAAWFSVVDWQALADGPGNSGPGGDDDGEDGDDAGPDDGDNSGPGGDDDEGGDGVLRIGRGGDQRVADDLRDSLTTAFRVVGSSARKR
jgi:hypothetical protein